MNAIDREKARKQQANYCHPTQGTCQKYSGEEISRCIEKAKGRQIGTGNTWNCKCPYSDAQDSFM